MLYQTNKTAQAMALAFALFTTHAMADVNVVVPGKAAGFLYLQGGGGGDDGKVPLKVSKTPLEGKPLFQTYRIESDPQGLVCDENCAETVHKFPEGQVELKIIGNKPVPGVSIPLTGLWSGDCHETNAESDTCLIALNGLNGVVSVQVDGTLETGAIINLPNLGSVMYIDMDTSAGYLLVAAHESLGTSMTLIEHEGTRTSDPNIKNDSDGRVNQPKLIAEGSNAAQYCKNLGSGWYLPARNELKKLEGAVLTKVPGLSASLWSSTEKDFKYETKDGGKKRKWKYEAWYLSRSSSNGHGEIKTMTAYEFEMEKKNNENKIKKNNKASRQVLCFNRVSL